MRYLRLALLPLVFAACTDTQAPRQDQPLFNFSNGPEQSGIVERASGAYAVSWPDQATGWRVVFGADMLEFCDGIIDFDELQWADKYLPTDDRIVSLNTYEPRTSVWPFTDFDCALFTTVEPLATGYSKFTYVDNDLSLSEHPNVNSWGFKANGTLAWTMDGSPAAFNFHRQTVVKKNGTLLHFHQTLSLK
jgi:hypothetical protein